MLVEEAGLVTGIPAHTLGGKNWLDLRLTWQGHEYLDSIRDPEIWTKTQGGSFDGRRLHPRYTQRASKGLIKKKIEDHTG